MNDGVCSNAIINHKFLKISIDILEALVYNDNR